MSERRCGNCDCQMGCEGVDAPVLDGPSFGDYWPADRTDPTATAAGDEGACEHGWVPLVPFDLCPACVEAKDQA